MKCLVLVLALVLIACSAFAQPAPAPTVVLQACQSVQVQANCPTPTPTSTPTLTPTPTPTASPSPVPTPTPIPTPLAWYFSSAGDDTLGDGSINRPFKSLAKLVSMIGKAAPGTRFLLDSGSVWHEQILLGTSPTNSVNGTSLAPIVIGHYGIGRPLLDEQNNNPFCVAAFMPTVQVNGLVTDGIECTHASSQGIVFRTGTSVGLQNITITNNFIHNTGPGCSTTDGPCVGNDASGGYKNQLDVEDDSPSPHSFVVVGNIVKWVGGHNAIQVHGDTGSPIVAYNTAGPGFVHNGIDEKLVGDFTKGHVSLVSHNKVACGYSLGLCGAGNSGASALYTQNNSPAVNENILWEYNEVTDVGGPANSNAFGILATSNAKGCSGVCPIVMRVYNNTLYSSRNAGSYGIGMSTGAGGSEVGSSTLDARNNNIDGFGVRSFQVMFGMKPSNPIAQSVTVEDYNSIGGYWGSPGFYFGGATQPGPHDISNINPKYKNNLGTPPDLGLLPNSPLLKAGLSGLTLSNNIGAY